MWYAVRRQGCTGLVDEFLTMDNDEGSLPQQCSTFRDVAEYDRLAPARWQDVQNRPPISPIPSPGSTSP